MTRWILLLATLTVWYPAHDVGADDAAVEAAPTPWPGEELAGGETTVFDRSHSAFGRALSNLERSRWLTMRAGKRLFEGPWQVPDLASEPSPLSGLGPRFNAVSCSGCHFRDGRGAPPKDAMAPPEPPPSIVRLRRAHGEPDPRYGAQLNDLGAGVAGEGAVSIDQVETSWHSPDGRAYPLRRPRPVLSALALGPLHPDTRSDLRIPPTLVGMGLLEAVPVEVLEALADPTDQDGDQISGRLRYLPGPDGTDGLGVGPVVGRFGWTAAQPDLEAQVAHAFHEDLGVTSSRYPDANCPDDDVACRRLAEEAVEISTSELEHVALYTRLLAPPARRDWDHPEVLRGREAFTEIGCASCHVPSLRTAERNVLPELSGLTIRPFTDLLLHDMGPDLADEATEPGLEPGEWRTTPLWGLGLLERINGHLYLLHDGRARTIEEAILWHGGEAAGSRQSFVELSSQDHEALLRFLESL